MLPMWVYEHRTLVRMGLTMTIQMNPTQSRPQPTIPTRWSTTSASACRLRRWSTSSRCQPLRKYLVAVLGERWPDQLLLAHGVDHVRQTLRAGHGPHGLAFRAGGDQLMPAAYFRWLLKSNRPWRPPRRIPFPRA